jgi:glutathione S-transferase
LGGAVTGGSADKLAREWERLERHFRRHRLAVKRFAGADAAAVAQMWETGTDAGKRLSNFEREALVERYCELFGCWPESH